MNFGVKYPSNEKLLLTWGVFPGSVSFCSCPARGQDRWRSGAIRSLKE
ncbi:hypothetical protein HMPREF3197_03943 [Klebsiella pneumoniae]|nr:hypothetical protein HMPREF3197_03943 [Klebsiella pneumoniae]